MLIHADDNNFKSVVLDKNETVLVDFFADWCSPCQMLSPIVEDIAKDFNVCKVNVDTSPMVTRMYNIQSIPTLVVMKNGKIVNQSVGAKPKPQIVAMLEG